MKQQGDVTAKVNCPKCDHTFHISTPKFSDFPIVRFGRNCINTSKTISILSTIVLALGGVIFVSVGTGFGVFLTVDFLTLTLI